MVPLRLRESPDVPKEIFCQNLSLGEVAKGKAKTCHMKSLGDRRHFPPRRKARPWSPVENPRGPKGGPCVSRSPSPFPLTRDALEGLFPPSAWLAGEDYVGLERLSRLLVAPGMLAGEVSGQRADYWVTLGAKGPTCSVCRIPCRHAAAVAQAWIRNSDGFLDVQGLIETYLGEKDPSPLIEGLLQDNVLESLRTFTEGLFIPPFDPQTELVRFQSLSPDEKPLALSRLMRPGGSPALFARALALAPDAPFLPLAKLALEAEGEVWEALSLWLQGHPHASYRQAFLDHVLAVHHAKRAEGLSGKDVLRRAARVLALFPGGEDVLVWLVSFSEGEGEFDLEASRFLKAVGRPREALRTLDRSLLGLPENRLVLLQEASALSGEMGSPREAYYRLDLLRHGDVAQIATLREKFPEIFREEGPRLLAEISPKEPFAAAELALALGDAGAALRLARESALPYSLLRRLVPIAKKAGEDPGAFILDGLSMSDRRRLEASLRRSVRHRPSVEGTPDGGK